MIDDINFLLFEEKKNLTDLVKAVELFIGILIGMLFCVLIIMFFGITSPSLELSSAFAISLLILIIAFVSTLYFVQYAKLADKLTDSHEVLNYHPEDTDFGAEIKHE